MTVVNSALDWDIENLGTRHFGVSREEVMAASIYKDKSVEYIFNMIENQAETNKLDRIYSTDQSASYFKI